MAYLGGNKVIDETKELKYVGAFQIKSGKAIITDPCYKLGTWCQLENIAVRKGEWKAIIMKSDESEWGKRIKELHVYHGSIPIEKSIIISEKWEEITGEEIMHDFGSKDKPDFRSKDICVGVDAGCCGVYDYVTYEKNKEKYVSYNYEKQAETFKQGVTSSSGFGDGSYPAYALKNAKDEIIGLKIIFIYDENEDIESEIGAQ